MQHDFIQKWYVSTTKNINLKAYFLQQFVKMFWYCFEGFFCTTGELHCIDANSLWHRSFEWKANTCICGKEYMQASFMARNTSVILIYVKCMQTSMNQKQVQLKWIKENAYCVCLSKCLQHFYSNTFNLHVSGTLESLHT